MHYTLRRDGVIRKAIESRLACPRLGSWKHAYFLCRTAPDSLRGATDVTDQDRPGQLTRVIRMANTAHSSTAGHGAEGTRRDFLYLTAGAFGAVGAGATLWPFIHQMNPSADVLALSTIEVDIAAVQPGQSIKAMWRSKPVFIRRRTEQEIQQARAVNVNELPDPQADQARVKKAEWLILVGVCTHLGCVPLGTSTTDPRGEFGGWFCPCHGSQYDISGRVRHGPAPANLPVPPYKFGTATTITIG